MTSQSYHTSGISVSGVVDPAFWSQDLSDSSPLNLQLSPAASYTTQDSSVNSFTSPTQTPQSESGTNAQNGQINGQIGQSNGQNGQSNGQNGQSNDQSGQSNAQNRASVAVACVPCRSRHLKCDGGVRCSRCRAEGSDCTYIKSRRGWKGKRKRTGENGIVPAHDASFLSQRAI